MEQQVLDKILITTYTLESLKRRLKALKSRLSEHFFGSGTNQNMVSEELEWLNSYGVQFLNLFQKETFYQSFSQIDKMVSELQTLTIYLAFSANPESEKQIGSWLRDNLSTEIVMDVKLDPSLIGGCAFIWKGVYRDYSLRSKIQTNRAQILTSFKTFMAEKTK